MDVVVSSPLVTSAPSLDDPADNWDGAGREESFICSHILISFPEESVVLEELFEVFLHRLLREANNLIETVRFLEYVLQGVNSCRSGGDQKA